VGTAPPAATAELGDIERSGSELSGAVSGVLIFDVAAGANVGYTALAPTITSDAPITNTLWPRSQDHDAADLRERSRIRIPGFEEPL
jgi:hypothetical protein